MIGVYVVWKKVKNLVISTPTWYVVCEINNKTCLNKWKCHKVDIRVIFSIFYGVRLDPSWYDLYVKYVGRMKVKLVLNAPCLINAPFENCPQILGNGEIEQNQSIY